MFEEVTRHRVFVRMSACFSVRKRNIIPDKITSWRGNVCVCLFFFPDVFSLLNFARGSLSPGKGAGCGVCV